MVIVIIGVLAAFGVPQFLKSVERSKAAEAFNYLAAVRAAQERYLAKEGIYCHRQPRRNTGHRADRHRSTSTTLDINQSDRSTSPSDADRERPRQRRQPTWT